MKKGLLITMLLASLALSACGGGAADSGKKDSGKQASIADTKGSTSSGGEKRGGKLVVYTMNSEGLVNATIPLFEEKYGIDVEVIQAGTGELIKRIQSEKDDPYGDVMFGGSWSLDFDNKDLWQEYVSPNNDGVIDAYKNTTGFITPYVLDGSCLIVNKELAGGKITSYEDLLKPELKGKIATADPANSSSAFAQLTNILLAKGGYEDEKAWNYVKELFTNIDGKIQSGSSAVYKSVADGEMAVGLSYEDPCAQLVKDGANVEVVYPSEGSVYLPAGTTIIKDCKNLDNAKLFVDFVISEEMQNIYGTTLTNRPVRKDAKTSETMKPFSEIKVIEEDMDYVSTHKKDIVEKYTDIFTTLQSK